MCFILFYLESVKPTSMRSLNSEIILRRKARLFVSYKAWTSAVNSSWARSVVHGRSLRLHCRCEHLRVFLSRTEPRVLRSGLRDSQLRRNFIRRLSVRLLCHRLCRSSLWWSTRYTASIVRSIRAMSRLHWLYRSLALLIVRVQCHLWRWNFESSCWGSSVLTSPCLLARNIFAVASRIRRALALSTSAYILWLAQHMPRGTYILGWVHPDHVKYNLSNSLIFFLLQKNIWKSALMKPRNGPSELSQTLKNLERGGAKWQY